MLDWVPSAPYTAEQLLEVLRILRDPENGCPWDKVQTHASIRKNFLEETCEALEAIDGLDLTAMTEFKRAGNGAVEIKFTDRLKALEKLMELIRENRETEAEELLRTLGGTAEEPEWER